MKDFTTTTFPTYSMQPIGVVRSCFEEKFAVPRQPGLVPSAYGTVELIPPFNHPDMVDGLKDCSHIWIQFVFHECLEQGWQMKVRPPRLGGNKKMGVLATRSTHRPNSLGLSVVKLVEVETQSHQVTLHIQGQDLVDGTPVLDIKPYIPYSDSIETAQYPFAQAAPNHVDVYFMDDVLTELKEQKNSEHLQSLIIEVLQQDPKPAFHKPDPDRHYGARLAGKNVKWRYIDNKIEVIAVETL